MPKVRDRYEVALHCGYCRRTTPHSVVSGSASVSRVLCIVCGRAVAVDTLQFMEQYVDTVMRRLLAKPFEITTQFRRQPREFITRLPGRVLTKPFRVAAELRTTVDIVRPRRGRVRAAAIPLLPPRPGELPSVQRRCRVLLSAPVMWAHPPEEIIAVAHDLGYDGVELWDYHLVEMGSDPAAVAARAREQGMALTLHAMSWDLNPTSRLDAVRAASLEALHHSIAVAARLGAGLVVMHPGRVTMPYDDAERYWAVLVAGVRELAAHAAQRGLRLGVEHMEPRQGEYVVTADEANRLVHAVDRDNVGTTLDVAHIPWGTDEAAFIAALERVVHVHLSDADEARLHLPLGEGSRNLVRALGALGRYDGGIAVEGHSMGSGVELARWNKAQFEELWRAAAESAAAAPI